MLADGLLAADNEAARMGDGIIIEPSTNRRAMAAGTFKTKREEWLQWLSGDDRHAVMKQISGMIWDAAVFRVINEARKHAEPDGQGGIRLNGPMHQLITDGFFSIQATGVRRLLDRQKCTGPREVYSLRRLLDDLERNVAIMTRENMLAAEELPYDYEAVHRAFIDHVRAQIEAGETGASCYSRDLDSYRPKARHEAIDRLCDVSEDCRSPGDHVRSEVLMKLKEELAPCEQFKTYVDKFIAHAAAPGSRARVNADEIKIPLKRLWEAHEAMFKVAHFVGIHLLGDSIAQPLPFPQFDQFEHMDRPLIETEKMAKLSETWRQYEDETEQWLQWGLDEFFQETGI